jgi:hypothetical protein
MRVATWLELAMFGAAPSASVDGGYVVVRPLDLDSGRRCFVITFDQRRLCDSNGALTVFDSLAAASLFLHFLKVDRFKLDEHHEGDARVSGHDNFHYCRLNGRRLVQCGTRYRSTTTLRLPATLERARSAKTGVAWQIGPNRLSVDRRPDARMA